MPRNTGKFVLRVSPELHRRLRRAAEDADTSLNSICVDFIQRGLEVTKPDGGKGTHPLAVPILEFLQKNNLNANAVLLFGSVARNEETDRSDTDILIVLEPGAKITRQLYHLWDNYPHVIPKGFPALSPHFVALPSDLHSTGSLWNEVALEGISLWEKDDSVRNFLIALRKEIAAGRWVRKISHGHPYWLRKMQ